MRLGKRGCQARVNGRMRIEFSPQSLTSYSGLELLDRFLRSVDLDGRVRRAFAEQRFSGDYSVVSMIRLLRQACGVLHSRRPAASTARAGDGDHLRFRLDGAFFHRPMLEELSRRDVEYALKVPMHPWKGEEWLRRG